jgi:hypothetical protein
MEDAMKAAIVQASELIMAALIFGAVIGLVAPLNSLDAQSGGAKEGLSYSLSRIPHAPFRSQIPGAGYGAI